MTSRIETQNPPNPFQRIQGTGFDPKKHGRGRGVGADTDEIPPVPQHESFAKALASLTAFSSGTPQGDVEVLLVELAVAMRDAEALHQKGKINADQDAKKAQLLEKQAKLEEAQRKIEEAEEKKSGGSLIDKIKLAFEWVTAILTAVAAVALILTGGGAVMGSMLAASAFTSLVMAVDSTVMMTTGNGIAGNIALLFGASEEEAAQADMGFKLGLAGIGILLSLGAAGTGIVKGVASAASTAANAASMGAQSGTTAAQSAATTAKTVASSFLMGGKMARVGVNLGQAGVSLASAGTNVASTAVKYEESTLRADAKSMEADAKKDEALIQMLDEFIDQALARLMASSERFSAMIEEITDAMADQSNTLSRTRFAG